MLLTDGFSTKITFATESTVLFREKSVTPPSMSAGGENDVTTMHNTVWRTKAPKGLKSMGSMSASVAYDPQVYQDIIDMINVNQLITVTFPDGSKLAFWGWLDEFTPSEAVEGTQPTADITIICSNQTGGATRSPTYSPT